MHESGQPIRIAPVRLHKNAKVDLLRRVPLFAGCSKAEVGQLASVADELDLREGATLTREGQSGREFFVIVEGSVKVTKNGRTIAELEAGDWLGEIALLTDSPRTATATAMSPVRILVITDRAFRQLVERMPSIALKVLSSVGERLAQDTRR
jgi:CRP/FNR family transcriptional regulator, cyclic AMP receptor protein